MYTRSIIAAAAFVLSAAFVAPAWAAGDGGPRNAVHRTPRGEIMKDRHELHKDVRDLRKEKAQGDKEGFKDAKQELKEDKQELKEDLKDKRDDRKERHGNIKDRLIAECKSGHQEACAKIRHHEEAMKHHREHIAPQPAGHPTPVTVQPATAPANTQ